jgi:3-dehydroquinate synthase
MKDFRLNTVMEAMQHDKKIRDGVMHFVLPRRIGEVEIARDVPLQLVRDTVKALLHESEIGR